MFGCCAAAIQLLLLLLLSRGQVKVRAADGVDILKALDGSR